MKDIQYKTANLEAATKRAQAASQAKSDFLSNMSHEMRTPMNAIIGMTAIGSKAKDVQGKDQALEKIGEASAHLLGLINDVLDMAKIEAKKLELIPLLFHFEKSLLRVLAVLQYRIDEKEQKLTVCIDPGIPVSLLGDETRIIQVVTNLLSNAIKFTPEGGNIFLGVSMARETRTHCELRIEVTDDGIGVSAEQQTRLFDAFEQADSGTSREYGGTGLGLSITKRIVEMMGGRIWVESELGHGAKFVAVIQVECGDVQAEPCGQTDGAGHENPETQNGEFSGKKMLLAEDIDINRHILMVLLEESGLEIDCAETGKEALDMVAADPEKYDVVFMDLQMPQMSGIEATRLIRALPPRRRGRLPIIAMTANVFKDDIEACVQAGMDGHLGKPLDIDKVFAALRVFL